MFCAKCGTVLPHRASACPACRTPVATGSAPVVYAQTTQKQTILCYIFGAILILCGIFPLVFRGDQQFYSQYINYLYSQNNYAYYAVSTISSATGFLTTIPNAVLFIACSLSILSGILMLKKCHNIRGIMIVTAIAQFFSLLSLSICLDMLDYKPRDVFTLLIGNNNDPFFINDCIAFLKENPYFLDFYRQLAVLRNIIAIIVILSTIIFLFLAKPHAENMRPCPTRISHAGIALMLFALGTISLFSPSIRLVQSKAWGSEILSAYLCAGNLFDSLIELPCTLILLGIMILCILTPKVKRYIVALPTVLILLVLGTAVYLSGKIICQWANIPASLFAYTTAYLQNMGLEAGVMLIGLFLWFQAVAQGRVNLGWQIVIPVLMFILYIVYAIFAPDLLSSPVLSCLSFAFVGIVLSLITLCFPRPRTNGV